jgi:hypothetical protein
MTKSLVSFRPPQFLQEYENDIPNWNIFPFTRGVGGLKVTELFWKETPGFIEASIRCRVCSLLPAGLSNPSGSFVNEQVSHI